MGKRKTITVAGEVFRTKKDLIERVQGIIQSYDDHELLGFFDLEFMTDLLRRHPKAQIKFGCGVAGMYVTENPIYPGRRNRGFRLIRSDETETDFSYRECISPKSYIRKVKAAFRVAIEPQVMDFKQRFFDAQHDGLALCPDTGEVIAFTGAHADHVAPLTFEQILADFLEMEGLTLRQVKIAEGIQDNKYQDKLADPGLTARWAAYHRDNAVLEIVSRHANLSARKVGGHGR